MPARKRPRAVLQEALDLVTQHGGSFHTAAQASGIDPGTLRSRHAAAIVEGLRPSVEPATQTRLPVSADECWEVLNRWIGRKRIPAAKPPKWQAKAEQRIVIASDFHAPFHDAEAVAALVEQEADRTDTLVINGDLSDGYSISRFIKYETVPMEQEIAAVDALLSLLASKFRDIVIVDGNHDKPRFEKQLRAILTPDLMHAIEYLTGGNLSIIKALAKRHPNVRFAPIQVGAFALGWATQIGDLICTHAEKYSRVPGAALRSIDEWFTDQRHMLDLPPYRVLVQAHTHQGGIFPWEADKLLVECGCLCQTHGYMLQAKVGGRPQRRGYVTLTQRAGLTDPNSVRFVWLDPLLRKSA